jgi:hypothetical protein
MGLVQGINWQQLSDRSAFITKKVNTCRWGWKILGKKVSSNLPLKLQQNLNLNV